MVGDGRNFTPKLMKIYHCDCKGEVSLGEYHSVIQLKEKKLITFTTLVHKYMYNYMVLVHLDTNMLLTQFVAFNKLQLMQIRSDQST